MASTVDRGYGGRHQALRAELAVVVAAGEVECARCGRLIHPWEPWDLGHVDGDRSRYAGPEHRRCNRATAGRGRPRRMTDTERAIAWGEQYELDQERLASERRPRPAIY
jgi:hypothetical protein